MSSVCIIIPCFNEERRLKPAQFLDYLELQKDLQFIFVDDGSRDGTFGLLEKIRSGCPEQADILRLKANHGKAEAVRAGIQKASDRGAFRYFGYMDCDLSTPLDEIGRFTGLLDENPDWKLIMGSRSYPGGTRIRRSLIMRLGGLFFAGIVSWFTGIRFYDTQCGFKIFRPEAAAVAFAEVFKSKWIFDIEIITRLIRYYGNINAADQITEFPLRDWLPARGSRISIWKKAASLCKLIGILLAHRKNLKNSWMSQNI